MSAILQIPSSSPNIFQFNFGQFAKRLDDEEFYSLCQANEGWRIEQTSTGDLIVMPGTGGHTGRRNAQLSMLLGIWCAQDGTGQLFDSSTIFNLPNGARRSPDAAWVTNVRWNALSLADQDRFPPLCPDFVMELRSRTDLLPDLQAKMEEYRSNGAQLGWLIDPVDRRVYIYRPGAEVEDLENPETVSGEPMLPGFVLNLTSVWE